MNVSTPSKKISIVKSPRKYETFDELVRSTSYRTVRLMFTDVLQKQEPKLNSSFSKMVPKKTEPTPIPNQNLFNVPSTQITSTSPPIDDLLADITSTSSNITNLLYSPITNPKPTNMPYLQIPPLMSNAKEDELASEHSLISFSNSGIKREFQSPRKVRFCLFSFQRCLVHFIINRNQWWIHQNRHRHRL